MKGTEFQRILFAVVRNSAQTATHNPGQFGQCMQIGHYCGHYSPGRYLRFQHRRMHNSVLGALEINLPTKNAAFRVVSF